MLTTLFVFIATPASQGTTYDYFDQALEVDCDLSKGAGFQISEDFVATAKHVVENCTNPVIFTNNNQKIFGSEILQSLDKDLAYIRINSSQNVIPTFDTSPKIGEQIFAVGSPIDGLVLSKGKLLDIFDDNLNKWLVLAVAADHGNSGGPVFSSTGLIGMVISKNFSEGYVYAYPISTITEDLKVTKENHKNSFPFDSSKYLDFKDLALIPTLVFALCTFLFGLGLGIFWSRRYGSGKKRERIRIVV